LPFVIKDGRPDSTGDIERKQEETRIIMNPQVSVILPYYEGEKWLRRSLDSVRAQEGVSFEIIVVDDGSVHPAASVLSTLHDERIRTCRISHAGKGAALNSGARMAEAEVLCFIDQDDIMNPGRLRLQCSAFVDDPMVDAVYSDYERADEDGVQIDISVGRQTTNDDCLHQMASGMGLVSMQTIMIRKTFYWRIGGFSEDIRLTGLDDAEFMARLFASGATLKYVPGTVQKWVFHDMNYMKSENFQEARIVLLEHLSILAHEHPMIKKELPDFSYHNHYMRGLYYLENHQVEEAVPEFFRAIEIHPCRWNAYYLLLKSVVKKLL
jgi:glycosyltransferase involved in cell wall biosynthesis